MRRTKSNTKKRKKRIYLINIKSKEIAYIEKEKKKEQIKKKSLITLYKSNESLFKRDLHLFAYKELLYFYYY